jgi:Resolvase, N terminal domain
LRTAIYARYSSVSQREASIADQVEVCTRYADKQGWVIVGTYTDAAISGASRFRPGYQALLSDLDRGIFDVLVVEALDRKHLQDHAMCPLIYPAPGLGLTMNEVALAMGPDALRGPAGPLPADPPKMPTCRRNCSI